MFILFKKESVLEIIRIFKFPINHIIENHFLQFIFLNICVKENLGVNTMFGFPIKKPVNPGPIQGVPEVFGFDES